MKDIRKILVPTDFSEFTGPTLDFADVFARKFGAEVHLLHVMEDPLLYASTTSEEYRAPFERVATDKLDAIVEKFGDKDIPVVTALAHGKPYVAINEYAKEHDIDLIVIGTQGHGAVTYVILGSVVQNVIRTSHCPVLTVRHPEYLVAEPR